MQYREIGRTNIKVSTVAMGCWGIVGDFNWGPQDESDALNAIETALDTGINFFDTAESYGNGYSEELLGKTLSKRRKNVVIASKVAPSNLEPQKLVQACENSLERLKTDYIDIYQIHWPNVDIPFEDTLNTLEKLKKEGKIRVAGCSNFGPKDLSDALEYGRLESNQVAYNLLWRGIEFEVQNLCREKDVSLLLYSPLLQGLLTGKFDKADDVPAERARTRHFSSKREHTRHGEQGAERLTFQSIDKIKQICEDIGRPMAQVSLAYLLTQKGVTSVIAGMRNAGQAEKNAQAADCRLTQSILDQLSDATDELKAYFGDALDMWESEERIQ